MLVEFHEETSPLDYERSDNVYRFALFAPELVDVPFLPGDTYFAVTERVHRYGANRRLLKKPRIEITPGAQPGTLAWLDWHTTAPSDIYIDFMKVRNDWRGRGIGRQLVEGFYQHVVDRDAVTYVNWGDIMSDYAEKLFHYMRRQYPHVQHKAKL